MEGGSSNRFRRSSRMYYVALVPRLARHGRPSPSSHAVTEPAAAITPLPVFHALEGGELERFLRRTKVGTTIPQEVDLGFQLQQLLERARELVPSQSGAILLDDPLRKVGDRAQNDLWFVAAFGPASDRLPGTRVPAGVGVATLVYRTGESHLASDVRLDPSFYHPVERATMERTHSIVAAPIAIGSTVCGVIELVDRSGGAPFDERELALLEIFAGYTSSTLQNALDAKRAAELARRDDLTGLYNDRWLHHRLVEMIAQADRAGLPCTLMFFDLDFFKQVNDSHGHLAGSAVLREIGYLLRRLIPDPDAILARYGGDEFVVGLPGTALAPAAAVAERIRAAIEAQTFIDRDYGPGLPALSLRGAISASIGLAEYRPQGGDEPAHVHAQRLLHLADAAMYAAKAEGKNRIVSALG